MVGALGGGELSPPPPQPEISANAHSSVAVEHRIAAERIAKTVQSFPDAEPMRLSLNPCA